VYHITPLLTSIEEYASQGFTGKIVSFPNKTIFEKNVKNWSRGSDFSLMTLDFLLTHQSDINSAKKLLLDVVCEKEKILYETLRRDLNTFKATYKYMDSDLEPQIHVVSDPRGIILRVRVLVHVQDKLSEQSRIMEDFSTAVQKETAIAFRTV
jgi:small-conductance mechanosensitive channel